MPPFFFTKSASFAASVSSRKNRKIVKATPCSSIRPFHFSLNSLNTGHTSAPCVALLMRCVRIADVPCAYAHFKLNSMRVYTSSFVQCRSSFAHESSAPASEPDWFLLLSHVCPLSMCVCRSTNVGNTIPPSTSTWGRVLDEIDDELEAGVTDETLPVRISMSTKLRPS